MVTVPFELPPAQKIWRLFMHVLLTQESQSAPSAIKLLQHGEQLVHPCAEDGLHSYLCGALQPASHAVFFGYFPFDQGASAHSLFIQSKLAGTGGGRGGGGLHRKSTHELHVSSVLMLAWQQPTLPGSDPFPHTNSQPVNLCPQTLVLLYFPQLRGT
jgi:hypothetical protein